MSSDYVYCKKCEKNGRSGSDREKIKKNEIEQTLWNSWVCSKCISNVIGLELIDFIKTRINVTATEDEDRSKFIFRELLQNADDVGATILVLTFSSDALYVANNGRAFTTDRINGEPSDFERISRILGRHQAEDKDTVGHFGSGFQTVYALTNSPEVHSSGISGKMNPSLNEWDYSIDELKSPYIDQKKKGVLFRLPWRDDRAAKEYIKDEQVFIDQNYWPRWNKKTRREFYKNLSSYLHHSILACQNLTAIRLIWDHGDEYEGYQVYRDFAFNKIKDETSLVGTIKEGAIYPKKWDEKWKDSNQLDSWDWKNEKTYDYLIVTSLVTKGINHVYIGKDAYGALKITHDISKLNKILKKGNVQLLLPLFDTQNAFPESDGRYYLYSVVPLPKRGLNRFAFSAHFFPTEDRKDVDVEGFNDLYREWYQLIMTHLCRLYTSVFPDYVDHIHSLSIGAEEKQNILLNSLPNEILPLWMRPGKDVVDDWWQRTFNLVIRTILSSDILYHNDKFVRLHTAFWPDDDLERNVINILGFVPLPETVISHQSFKKTLSDPFEDKKLDINAFKTLWLQFEFKNRDDSKQLLYNSRIGDYGLLDKEAVSQLTHFCILRPDAWSETIDIPIIPGKDNVLRPLHNYPKVPSEIDIIYDILPSSKIIHEDFESLLSNEGVKDWTSNCEEIIDLIDEIVRSDENRFSDLNTDDHCIFSQIIAILVTKLPFALKEYMCDQYFIPYQLGGMISIGTPNSRNESGVERLISGSHIAENYQRDSIFGVQSALVPGVSDLVKSKIKFLALTNISSKDIDSIEKALNLVKLMETNVPVNFVRHFLSNRHGTLFDDDLLSKFLDTSEKSVLNSEKKNFHETILRYFDSNKTETYLRPNAIAQIPCLYDSNEVWDAPKNFALNINPELELFGYKALHDDLSGWNPAVLKAIGISESPTSSRIVQTIQKLLIDKENNRTQLANIAFWLLTSDVKLDEEFNKVKGVPWIPIINNEFETPGNVLIPSESNRLILGINHSKYIDHESCSPEISQKILEKKIKIEESRCRKLGLKISPELEDFRLAVKAYRQKNETPPSNLFDSFNEYLSKGSRKEGKPLGYYYGGHWVNSSDFYILEEKAVSDELKSLYTILPVDVKHALYLLYDGAKNRLNIEDFLQPIVEGKLVPTLNMWDEIRFYKNDIDYDIKEKYGVENIYPYEGTLLSPNNVYLLDECKSIKENTRINDYFLCGQETLERHGEILNELGAKYVGDLDSDSLTNMLMNFGNIVSPRESALVLFLLSKIAEYEGEVDISKASIWPASIGGEMKMTVLGEAYIDDSPHSELFRDDVLVLLTDNRSLGIDLEDFALQHGAARLSAKIVKEGDVFLPGSIRSPEVEMILSELVKALQAKFSAHDYGGVFDWLVEAKVYIRDTITIKYRLENIVKRMNKYALINGDESEYIINVVNNHVKMYEDLTNEIIRVAKSFNDVDDINELKMTIYQLLSQPVSYWNDLIPQYQVSIPTSQPIVYSYEPASNHYHEIKTQLNNWYSSCQICGNQTPADETGVETCETVKSVVSKVGGRYKGVRDDYTVGNCLLLCPRHQTLFERKLIRFPELEASNYDELLSGLEIRLGKIQSKHESNPTELVKWDCEVFEGTRSADMNTLRPSWRETELVFRPEHLIKFLENMRTYIEEKKG